MSSLGTKRRVELKSRVRTLVVSQSDHGFWFGLFRPGKFSLSGTSLSSAVGEWIRIHREDRSHDYKIQCEGAFFNISKAEADKVAKEFGIPLPVVDSREAA